MEFKDYYQVMGVPRDATEAQIKQAYRKLARKFHPDVSKEKDAEERFKDVGEAYEVLKSPQKRAAYDQLGKGPRRGEQFHPPPDFGSNFEFSGAGAADPQGGFSEFFESLFGAQGRAGARRERDFGGHRGEDHHAKVLLDLEAALSGGSRTITLRIPEFDAAGKLVSKERTLNVQIPKGILAGQTIRLAGQGGRASSDEPAGDLYVEVEFQPHPFYRTDGRDLYLDLPVAPWEAALGATVKTPTPNGPVDLKVPPNSHQGSKLRLKGRGIPASPAGDFFIVLHIALPPASDAVGQAAYMAFAKAQAFNPRAHLGEQPS